MSEILTLVRRCDDLQRHVDVLRGELTSHGIDAPSFEPSPPRGAPTLGNDLSARETEVLALMAEGLSNAEIAEQLYVGVDTVKTHAQRVYKKIGVRNRAAAAVWFISKVTPNAPGDAHTRGTSLAAAGLPSS